MNLPDLPNVSNVTNDFLKARARQKNNNSILIYISNDIMIELHSVIEGDTLIGIKQSKMKSTN